MNSPVADPNPPASADASITDSIRCGSAGMMRRFSPIAMLNSMVSAGLLCLYIVLNSDLFWTPLLWLASVAATHLPRVLIDGRGRDHTYVAHSRWQTMVVAQQFLHGAVWGLVYWVPGVSDAFASYMVFLFAAIIPGVAVFIAHAPVATASIAFMTSYCALSGLFLLGRSDLESGILGGFCFAVGLMHVVVARRVQTSFLGYLRLQQSHTALLKKAEEQKRKEAAAAADLQRIIDALDVSVTVYDSDFRLKTWNKAALTVGVLQSDLARPGITAREIMHALILRGQYSDASAADEIAEASVNGLKASYRKGADTWTFDTNDGRRLEAHLQVLDNGDVLICDVDITATKQQMDSAVRHVSRHCDLTGLLNRTAVRSDLTARLSGQEGHYQRLAVMIIDLQGLRMLNNALGAEIGDQLLCTIADRLGREAMPDDLVARISGDEFALVFDAPAATEALDARLKDILTNLEAPFSHKGQTINMHFRAGVTLAPDHGQTSDQLFARAAVALKAAKSVENLRYRIYDEMLGGENEERDSLRLEIDRALEKQQFMVYFQPQLNLADGMVVGVESLIRWLHPEFGWIAPSKFIPVAESGQQILEITEWLLPRACREAKTWIDMGWPDIVVSVNISPVHFLSGNLVELVQSSLDDAGLPARNLELELTEGMILPDADHVARTMARLRDVGVRLAIDDFGTGYSAMSYLKTIPFEKLKIDRSFVREIEQAAENRSIVTAINQMAHGLGYYVIAEGVETPEQEKMLRSIGCDGVQGFLYSKPLPPEHFRSWLRSQKTPALAPGKAMRPRGRRAAKAS